MLSTAPCAHASASAVLGDVANLGLELGPRGDWCVTDCDLSFFFSFEDATYKYSNAYLLLPALLKG